jgi:outer membrane lipoprotein carrier protein
VAWLALGCASTAQQAEPRGLPTVRANAVLAANSAAPVAATATAVAPEAAQAPLGDGKLLPDVASDVHDVVAGVDALYGNVTTFKATFRQRYGYGRTKDPQGSVRFEKPNKMSWRYDNGNRVVSDGHLVKVYEKASKQLYEHPLEKTHFPAALSFLLAQGKIEQAFKLTKLDASRLHFVNGHTIQAEPRSATTAYERLVWYIDATSYQVRRVLISDAQGNRNRYDFSAFEMNKRMPDHEFEFTPPSGTLVIRP